MTALWLCMMAPILTRYLHQSQQHLNTHVPQQGPNRAWRSPHPCTFLLKLFSFVVWWLVVGFGFVCFFLIRRNSDFQTGCGFCGCFYSLLTNVNIQRLVKQQFSKRGGRGAAGRVQGQNTTVWESFSPAMIRRLLYTHMPNEKKYNQISQNNLI